MIVRILLVSLLPAALARAAAGELPREQWHRAAYRGYYRIFTQFEQVRAERYPLLRMRLRPSPARDGVSPRGLVVAIEGATTRHVLETDTLAGAPLPLLPRAAEEDAVLRLNRPQGSIQVGTQVAIMPRADGRYSLEYLHAACQQMIAYTRDQPLGSPIRPRKHCLGVHFRYWPERKASVRFEDNGVVRELVSASVRLPNTGADGEFINYALRFDQWPGQGMLATDTPPDVIDMMAE